MFVYNLIVAGSVEERMLALQQRKRNLADAIIGPAREGQGGLSEGDVEGSSLPLVAHAPSGQVPRT